MSEFCPAALTRTLADGQEQVPGKRVGVWGFKPQAIKYPSHLLQPLSHLSQYHKIKDGFLNQDLPKLKIGGQNDDFFLKPQSYAMACYAVKNSWSVWTQFMHLD